MGPHSFRRNGFLQDNGIDAPKLYRKTLNQDRGDDLDRRFWVPAPRLEQELPERGAEFLTRRDGWDCGTVEDRIASQRQAIGSSSEFYRQPGVETLVRTAPRFPCQNIRLTSKTAGARWRAEKTSRSIPAPARLRAGTKIAAIRDAAQLSDLP